MSTQRAKMRVVSNDTVDERLRAAFPEINLELIARKSTTLNAHNLGEKWDATVRNMQWWVDLINS